MFGHIRVSDAVWYGIGAVVCWVIATTTALPVWLRASAMGVGIVLLAAAVFAFVFAGVNIVVGHRIAIENAENNTPQVRIMEAAARMTDEQREAVKYFFPTLATILSGEPTPIEVIVLGDCEITKQFAREFFAGTALNFRPVRDYHDGTIERRWASLLTGHMTALGYATGAGANYPAHWLDVETKRRALKSIGLEMEE